MLVTYGQGQFIEKNVLLEGQIILSEHKLFLKANNEDLPQTYVPLEKIERIIQKNTRAHFYVRQSLYIQYEACFKGQKKSIDALIGDIVARRGFKKKLFRKEWVEVPC